MGCDTVGRCQGTRRLISEDSDCHNHSLQNLKFHMDKSNLCKKQDALRSSVVTLVAADQLKKCQWSKRSFTMKVDHSQSARQKKKWVICSSSLVLDTSRLSPWNICLLCKKCLHSFHLYVIFLIKISSYYQLRYKVMTT